MKRHNITGIAMLLALLLCVAPLVKAESLSVPEYRQQLHNIAAKVDSLQSHPEAASELVTSIPDQVSVATSSGQITVNNKSLKDDLAAFAGADEEKRPALLREVQSYILAMTAAAESYETHSSDL